MKLSNLTCRLIGLLALLSPATGLFAETDIKAAEDNCRSEAVSTGLEDEADIKHGMISYTSPIARALIGKDEGDAIEFEAPDGVRTFDILEVRYE